MFRLARARRGGLSHESRHRRDRTAPPRHEGCSGPGPSDADARDRLGPGRLTRRWCTGSVGDPVGGEPCTTSTSPVSVPSYLRRHLSAIQHPFLLRRFKHPKLPPETDLRRLQLERFSECEGPTRRHCRQGSVQNLCI